MPESLDRGRVVGDGQPVSGHVVVGLTKQTETRPLRGLDGSEGGAVDHPGPGVADLPDGVVDRDHRYGDLRATDHGLPDGCHHLWWHQRPGGVVDEHDGLGAETFRKHLETEPDRVLTLGPANGADDVIQT